MTRLSATIAKLTALRATPVIPGDADNQSRLKDLENFGSNPGALKAKIHIPGHVSKRPALVVVLHAFTQTAGGYDRGSGWSTLADEHGFLLLFPEQQRANNPNLCFNWFSPSDNERDRGEALSIRQMIAAMVETHGIDPSRIFVTGLSAGGAMTSVLLASYPDLFAGGAIIAGLPHGSASNVQQALQAMRGPGPDNAKALGDRVRGAPSHQGAWPTISIWHGSADPTVNVANADAILAQWLSVHDLGHAPDRTENIAGHRYRVWSDATGRPLIEDYRIANMGHGTPLATTGAQACGVAMPHMLEAGISSTRRIAASWGLMNDVTEHVSTQQPAYPPAEASTLPARRISRLEPMSSTSPHANVSAKAGVEKIIHDALRAAGLMR